MWVGVPAGLVNSPAREQLEERRGTLSLEVKSRGDIVAMTNSSMALCALAAPPCYAGAWESQSLCHEAKAHCRHVICP